MCTYVWYECVHACGHTRVWVSIHVRVYGGSKLTLIVSSIILHFIKARSLSELGAHFKKKKLTDWTVLESRTSFLQIFPDKNKKMSPRLGNIFSVCLANKEHKHIQNIF